MRLLKDFLKEKFNLDLSCETQEKFHKYMCELKAWNKRVNLTAIENDSDIEIKHFIDSLEGLCVFPRGFDHRYTVLDIGSGGGFPGIPIKLMAPDIKLTLVESIRKKAEFIHHLVAKLKLSDVEIINNRSELLPASLRETFDCVFCRAVAPVGISLELAFPWVKVGGISAFYVKKINNFEELNRVANILGGKFEKEFLYTLPVINEARKILMIRKIRPTDPKFPRRPGMAKKNPL